MDEASKGKQRSSFMQTCQVCGHVYGQQHRVIPGEWGGTYTDDNVVWLCPNHHAAIHLLMKQVCEGLQTADEFLRVRVYQNPLVEPSLGAFWRECVQPVVLAHMKETGRKALPLPRKCRKRKPIDYANRIRQILEKAGEDGLSLRELARALCNNVPGRVVRDCLKQLAEQGIASGEQTRQSSMAGRPREVWRILQQ
jgi:hypothetical protein